MAIKKKITPETSDLLRYVKGRVSEEERNLIEEWASESPENEKELLDVAKIHLAAGKGVVYSKEKTEAAFSSVMKKASSRSRRLFFKYAATAAAAAIALFALIWVLKPAEPDMLTLSAPLGEKAETILPDGTRVFLNGNSTLTYPAEFNGRKRMVSLVGEGYFEVKHSDRHPFIIDTGKGLMVEDLGTSFNVEAYDKDGIVRVSLIEGKVKVTMDSEKTGSVAHVLSPKDILTLDTGSGDFFVHRSSKVRGNEWIDGKIVLRETPLRDLLRQVSNNSGVKFVVSNPEIQEYKYTGEFGTDDLDTVLLFLNMASGIVSERVKTEDGETIILAKN